MNGERKNLDTWVTMIRNVFQSSRCKYPMASILLAMLNGLFLLIPIAANSRR